MRSESPNKTSNFDSVVFDVLARIFTFLDPRILSPLLRLVSSQWHKADKEAYGDFFSRAVLGMYYARYYYYRHFEPVVYQKNNSRLTLKTNSWFFHHIVRNPFYNFPYIRTLESLPTLCNLTKRRPNQISQEELHSIVELSHIVDHAIIESKTRGITYIPKGAFRIIAIGILFLLFLSPLLVPLILLIVKIGMARTNPTVFTPAEKFSCDLFEKNFGHISDDKVVGAILASCREMICNGFHHDRNRFITKSIMVTCRDKMIDPNSYSIAGIIFMMLFGATIMKVFPLLVYGLLAASYEYFVEKTQAYPEQLGWVKYSHDHFDKNKIISKKELDDRFKSSQRFFHTAADIARSQLKVASRIVEIPDSEPESFKLKIE